MKLFYDGGWLNVMVRDLGFFLLHFCVFLITFASKLGDSFYLHRAKCVVKIGTLDLVSLRVEKEMLSLLEISYSP